MQILRILAGAGLLASISLAPAFAKDHGKPVVGGPSHGNASPAVAGQSKSKGPLASPSGAGPKTNGSQSAKAHGSGKPTTSTTKTTTTKTTSTTASGTTSPPTTSSATAPVSPIATKISSKH